MVVLLLIAALFPALAGSVLAGSAVATPAAKSTAAASPHTLQLGVTVFALWRDYPVLNSMFQKAHASGASWVRVDASWCSLEEAGPGRVSAWYQTEVDAVVKAAATYKLKLLMMVNCTPSWALGGQAADRYPTDPAQYQRVMTYLSSRYRGRVAAWEIWNEPDCIGGPCPVGDPVPYVPILKAGFRGVRAGDAGATVVSGGISGNNVDWLQRMYAAGAHGYFDVLADHPYMSPASAPPNVSSTGVEIYRLETVYAVHNLMTKYGDGAKPIWFTEFGWTTATTGPNHGVDEATQAAYLKQTVQLVQDNYPYVTNAFWYAIRDRTDSTPYENLFGLLHANGTPKPSYAAMQTSAAWLAGR